MVVPTTIRFVTSKRNAKCFVTPKSTFIKHFIVLFSDGELSDLMRNKAANLFSPNFRSAVKGRGQDDKLTPVGLFGGENAIRSRLSDATKEDELLAKTLNKPYKRKGGNRGGRYSKYKGFIFCLVSTTNF